MYGYSKRPSKIKRFFIILFCLVIVAIGSIFFYSIYLNLEANNSVDMEKTSALRLYSKSEVEESNEVESFEDISKSIVGISKIRNNGITVFDLNAPQELGLGSGVIVSQDGYIISNWHVSGDKYSKCYVTIEDGKTYNGNVLWADKDLDLSIIKINTGGLKYLELGDSSQLQLGEEVWAIGNPVGLEFQRTITKGIISGLNRTIKIEDENGKAYMEDLIQTDASINAGNSGGALINKSGKLIGINTVKIETAEGIGFAVPINLISEIVMNYLNTGSFEEAYLRNFCI